MSPHLAISRRGFARRVATVAALSAPATATTALAQPANADKPAAADLSAAGSAEMLAELARRGDTSELSDEQLVEILSRAQQQLDRSRVLSDFPLVNADEPAFVFRAFRAADEEPRV